MSKESSATKRLIDAVDGLMEIVEGVRNARWSHEGRRLVDTPEWAKLYCAWNELHRADFVDELPHRRHARRKE